MRLAVGESTRDSYHEKSRRINRKRHLDAAVTASFSQLSPQSSDAPTSVRFPSRNALNVCSGRRALQYDESTHFTTHGAGPSRAWNDSDPGGYVLCGVG